MMNGCRRLMVAFGIFPRKPHPMVRGASFYLRKQNGDTVDISFPHTIRLIPNTRTSNLLPQALRDFRSAARNAVRDEIYTFRDRQLGATLTCEVTGASLSRSNVAVDHMPPNTFDQLLYDFCRRNDINPLNVKIGSEGGTVAVFEDESMLNAWQRFHSERASLRILSKLGNLQLPKSSVEWNQLWS